MPDPLSLRNEAIRAVAWRIQNAILDGGDLTPLSPQERLVAAHQVTMDALVGWLPPTTGVEVERLHRYGIPPVWLRLADVRAVLALSEDAEDPGGAVTPSAGGIGSSAARANPGDTTPTSHTSAGAGQWTAGTTSSARGAAS